MKQTAIENMFIKAADHENDYWAPAGRRTAINPLEIFRTYKGDPQIVFTNKKSIRDKDTESDNNNSQPYSQKGNSSV